MDGTELYSIRKLSITMPPPPLMTQTTYAELLERLQTSVFHQDFPQEGSFISKTIKGRKYWYFQPTGADRAQKYVGPETPELLDQIQRHKEVRDDEKERQALVS